MHEFISFSINNLKKEYNSKGLIRPICKTTNSMLDSDSYNK